MSKLEELIQEYCPDGVEYKCLGDVANIVRGASPRPISNYITSDEDGVSWIKIGDVKPGSKYIESTEERITKEGSEKSRLVNPGDFILSNSMSFGRPYIVRITGCIHDGWLALSGYEELFETDFLYYVLSSTNLQNQMKQKASQGGSIKNLNADIVRGLAVPLPALPVQREIVRVLDEFTLLSAELATELAARKKQYEYYRDELLTFKTDVEWKPFKDTCVMKAGKTISSDFISEEKDGQHTIPCYGGNGLRGFVSSGNEEGNFPLIGRQGALCGNVAFSDGEFYATEHAVVVKPNEEYDSRFLFHLLTAMNLNKYKSAGAQPGLAVKTLIEIVAPVPPLNVQERIAHVLDNFDAICSDLKIGLPAEIEARQKQYEYYRDKLLDFKEFKTV